MCSLSLQFRISGKATLAEFEIENNKQTEISHSYAE